MKHLAALALSAIVAALPATADARATVSAVRLEVQRETTDAAVIRRLEKTARSLCARTASPLFPGHEGRAWRCRRDAVAAALGRRGASTEA